MTLAEIRKAIRSVTENWSEDEDTLLPSDNVVLDLFINWACEDVVLDLVEFMPEDFLTYEDISLVADDNDYDLTAEWISIWAMQRKVTDKSYELIPYTPVADRGDYVGETTENPEAWFLKGTTIIFWPTPSTSKTDYARCWIVVPEATAIVENGPVYIPRMAHKLIVLDAAMLVGYMNDRDVGRIAALYKFQHERIKDSLTNRVQQQPQFINPSILSRISKDRRDKAFYDKSGYFGR